MAVKLVYIHEGMGNAWKKYFAGKPGVIIEKNDITTVDCDAIVSPANSFGFMDGGLDLALSKRFGWGLQKSLQKMISERPLKELLIGEAIVVRTGDQVIPYCISAPTMRVPAILEPKKSINAYLAMKAILVAIRDHKDSPGIQSVAIPGLGTGVGGFPAELAAFQMWSAFEEVIFGFRKTYSNLLEAQVNDRFLRVGARDIEEE